MNRYHTIRPDFYDQFSCKGGDCRYTCCQGWNITLSKDECRKIKGKVDKWKEDGQRTFFQKLPPEARDKIKEYRIALNEKSECPFLADDRLCRLQCEFGADILPITCVKFPRSNHMHLDDVIQTLSPGCERVLELIFMDRSIKLVGEDKLLSHFHINSKITPNMIKRYQVLQYHNKILSMFLCLLQAEDTMLENRLLLLGIAVRHIDSLEKEGRLSEIPEYIGHYMRALEATENIEELLPQPEMNPLALLHNLNIIRQCRAITDREYVSMLDKIYNALHLVVNQSENEGMIAFSSVRYIELKEKYQVFLSDKGYFMENLMVTFMLYMGLPFCPSISTNIWDNYMYLAWAYSIVKLCLTACMDEIHTDRDFIYYCSILMRGWAHNHTFAKSVISSFQENKGDTLAHIATLLYS